MNPLFWTSGKEGSYYDSRASFLTGDISDSGLTARNTYAVTEPAIPPR